MLVSNLSVMCNFTQRSTHAIQCSAILHNVFHFLLPYEIMHVALFSLDIAIQKTKHLNDCLINLASHSFLTDFQYTCWELLESVHNLKTLNHVYIKRNTTFMIWLTIVMRFAYNIRKMWCLVKFIISMQFYEVYIVRMPYLTCRTFICRYLHHLWESSFHQDFTI